MNRWPLISGLTVTLLLLLVLSGFCVWTTRSLTAEVDQMIANNFETIRVLRDLRTSVARIDAQYRSAGSIGEINRSINVFNVERNQIRSYLAIAHKNVGSLAEHEQLARIDALVQDYFANYQQYFALGPTEDEHFKLLNQTLGHNSSDMADLSGRLMDENEKMILARRDSALAKGRIVTIIAVGFAIFSVGIYVITSVRLTRAIFDPLRRLRDAIQQVRDRRFETLVSLEGGEELGQIASSFNEMARELHRYINETDERAVSASRVSRAIIEALPHPVYIVDGGHQVSLMNPRADALSNALGIPGALPGEVRRHLDAAAAEGRDIVTDDIRRAVRLPLAKDGPAAEADYLAQTFQMPAAFGGKPGWAVLLVDVTRLRRMDEAKTRALSTLRHEVKTPVAGVRMTLQLLLDEKVGPLTDAQRELVEAGRDDCGRLLAILQSLLELAQLESGRTRLSLTPQQPAELLTEALEMHAEAARRTGSELRVEAPPQLPAVMAEPMHTLRVLGNFLTNALKYGRPGEPITLRGQGRNDGYVRLSVVNYSVRSLNDAEQEHVFDPFFRRPGESAEGTGLGLAISREIAAAHGGRVGVFCPGGDGQVEFFFDLKVAG
ncbi:MAG TPA: ATP-binding protein [Candidatus Didemnitutus sp.]|nr:ATP-binding protein [Candidatus Didemnitutus sp.]